MENLFFIFFIASTTIVVLYTLTLTIEIIVSFISKIKKKKMKDKRIKLRVVYVTNADTHTVKQFNSDNDLSDCVCAALSYAKAYRCKIKSMNTLTTE